MYQKTSEKQKNLFLIKKVYIYVKRHTSGASILNYLTIVCLPLILNVKPNMYYYYLILILGVTQLIMRYIP